MDKEGLIIGKGGTLTQHKWVYDEDARKGSYVPRDVSELSYRFLFENCELEDGVTLKDVMLLMESNAEMYEMILGNWCDEIIDECLHAEPTVEDICTLEPMFLELYWSMGYDSEDSNRLSGYNHPGFHGWGAWDDDEKTVGGIAIEFSPSQNLRDYELRLRQEVVISDDWAKDNTKGVTYEASTYTLGHILNGIIWELSFCGSPKMRKEKMKDVEGAMAEVTEAERTGDYSGFKEIALPDEG